MPPALLLPYKDANSFSDLVGVNLSLISLVHMIFFLKKISEEKSLHISTTLKKLVLNPYFNAKLLIL